MSETNLPENDPQTTREKLEGEAGPADWKVLKPHFLRGAIITISPELDIIDAGVRIATDDTAQIEVWMSEGKITRPTQTDADAWEKTDLEMTALVIAPFVLVQQVPRSSLQ